MIIATAGHVDHGKTRLVRALTGIDTDTLAEERRRGMTIDIGFAWAELEPAGPPTAFVDLPGHARYLRNLLAGVAAVDAALLVVAADDGPMPQTREHLALLTLLGVAPAAIALTKIDRVSTARRAEVEGEIAALLAGGAFAAAPVFGLVATTGAGVAPLRRHLATLARSLPPRPTGGLFRLAVDRSFTLAGVGRVVTGAVLSGRLAVGDALVLSPGGAAVRVRGLQVQGRAVASAAAGHRVAINLAGGGGLRALEPARGDWLVAPAAHAPTRRLDVEIELVGHAQGALGAHSARGAHRGMAAPDALGAHGALGVSSPPGLPGMPWATEAAGAERAVRATEAAGAERAGGAAGLSGVPGALARRGGLLLHLGAAAVPVRVVPLFTAVPEAGSRGRVQLLLDQPVSSVQGDVFILRDPATSPGILAGGRVIDPEPPARGRSRPARAGFLAALSLVSPLEALARLSADAPSGVDLAHFGRARNLTRAELDDLCASLGLIEIRGEAGRRWGLAADRWQTFRARVGDALRAWHAQAPDRIGPGEAALAKELRGSAEEAGGLPGASLPGLLRAAITALVADGAVVREGLRLRLVDHRPMPSTADAALLDRVAALLSPGGLRPPIVGELAAGLALPLEDLTAALARLAGLGSVVQVAPNRYFLPATVAALADHARQLSAEAGASAKTPGRFDAAAYRDRTGIGRNLTVQVLEFLDREGVTRFDGSRRWAVGAVSSGATSESDSGALGAGPPGGVPRVSSGATIERDSSGTSRIDII